MIATAKNYLEQIIEKNDLNFDEAYELMTEIMKGNINNSHLSAILTALKIKEETAEEVAGFAKAMRDKSRKINCDDDNLIDVCGTGGDNSGSFNISTAVAFTVAGAGVKVAKHGNRSISSKSGSADVLEELGIKINLSPDQSEIALNKIGIAFLYAPLYHPAMRNVASIRKELAIKTVFNILGPLTNPAGVKRQIIGTFNKKTARIMVHSASYLDYDKVCFLCCDNKYDEIFLDGSTDVYEYDKNNFIKSFSLSNISFNYSVTKLDEIMGSTPKQNARIIMDVFDGKNKNGPFKTIAANSALALYSSGFSEDLEICTIAAEESIKSGAALRKLIQLREYCCQF